MCEFNINGNIKISRGEIPLWTKLCYSIYRLQPEHDMLIEYDKNIL